MKILISGHRQSKLEKSGYDLESLQKLLNRAIDEVVCGGIVIGLSGMADGIDLMFCERLLELKMGYHCYIPFDEQSSYMSEEDKTRREKLISQSWAVKKVRNSKMVEDCDGGIIVWDGQKGGTYNVFEQMITSGKPFTWIDPRNQRVVHLED